MKTKLTLISLALISLLFLWYCGQNSAEKKVVKIHFEPNWESLSQWTMPVWFDKAVLGIYCHWGVYSVPGYRFNDGAEQVDSGLWYGHFMYIPNGEGENYGVYDFHRKTYGDPMEFGYHDLVPLFKAEKWDPDQWVSLYKESGADFAGIAAEHGEGFVLWDSEYDSYNAMDKGPKRDILGDLFKAVRKAGLKTVATFHEPPGEMFDSARRFYPKGVGANDPRYADLYAVSDFDVLNKKLLEVVDKYQPDQLWFEDKYCGEANWKKFIAYYFNQAQQWGKEVVIAQKHGEAPLSCSILDIEGGIFPEGKWEWAGMTEPQEQRWQKDVPIGNYWAYAEGVGCRPVNMLVDGIVDRISKNGLTLLDVAPRADGTLPQEQIDGLKELGKWMAINKEALYGSKPASLAEGGIDQWKAGSIRFMEKEGYLYAVDLGNVWPTDKGFADYEESTPPAAPLTIPGVKAVEGSAVRLLGYDKDLPWHMEGNDLVIEQLPKEMPCDYAWSFKIRI